MYGFWREGYVYTKDVLSFWWFLYIVILFFAIYGAFSYYRVGKTGWQVIAFALLGVGSFVLAVGIASSVTRPFFEWLWTHIPYFNIFRDSQKFVGLLVLSYAYLGALGVNQIEKNVGEYKNKFRRLLLITVVAAFLALPCLYSFKMFGFQGELGVTDYPQSWYQVNDFLNQDKSDFNVLFLPWHEYINMSWVPNRDRRIGNPALVFFDKPVVQGDNIEMPGIASESTNPISRYISFLLGKSKDIDNLGELLAPLNIKYIILVDEADYQNYGFLNRQGDIAVALKEPGITVFRNLHEVSRAYGTNSIKYINGFDDYLELSRTEDVTEYLYLISENAKNQEPNGETESQVLNLTQKSPVTYEIGETNSKYVIFTVPHEFNTDSWTAGDSKEFQNLGFMPAFEMNDGNADVRYSRFYLVYLPGYLISLTTIVGISLYFVGVLRWKRRLPKV
jgi:hypothetical protein